MRSALRQAGADAASTVFVLGLSLLSLGKAAPALAAPAAAKAGGATTATPGASGTFELGLKGFADLSGASSTAAYTDLTFGYFFRNGLEAGLTALEGTTPTGDRDQMGVFSEYLMIGGMLMPFIGCKLQHAAAPRDSLDGKDAAIIRLYLGLNLQIASSAAVAFSFEQAVANHSVLGSPGQRRGQSRSAAVALRLYL